MPFSNAMNTILATQNGTAPHVTGNYGESRTGRGPHGGTDFNYQGGQSHVLIHKSAKPVTECA